MTPSKQAAAASDGIETGTLVVAGVEVFFRRTGGEGPPSVFVHGNPTHSEDWQPFLERLSGPALAFDLPGWGRSGRPSGFDYSMHGLASFFERALEEFEVGRHRLVVHDWGSLALIAAQRAPERVERLVVINAVPLLPGYRWHRIARLWRTPGVGEAINASLTRQAFALGLREARADWRPPDDDFVEMAWSRLDRGTHRAVLELYRSADPEELAAAGAGLGRLDCPALVAWGEQDRYLPAGFARAYAEALPGAELVLVPGAGHWPWHERPELIDRVVAFLDPQLTAGPGTRRPKTGSN